MAEKSRDDGFPWHLGVFDAHCHPTDTLASLQSIPSMRAKVLTVMATRAQDQELVANAAEKYGVTEQEVGNTTLDWSKQHRIIPAFGWHPWFSHQMYDESEYENASTLSSEQKAAHYQSVLTPKSDDRDFLDRLPDPRPFGEFISQTRKYLQKYPLALIGEVGLDRSFRIPEAWLPADAEERDDNLTPGGREGRRLSPYRVSMDHQRKVLSAQLALAGEMRRAVSCHGVAAHGIVYETVAQTWKGHERKPLSKRARKEQQSAVRRNASGEDQEDSTGKEAGPKPYPPRLCLHSYSGPAETVKQYTDPKVPCEIFFSFSTTINAWSEDGNGKVEAAVKAVPDDRVLVESDLHTAGEHMDQYLQEAVEKICQVKGWELEDGVIRLGQNWKRFAFGGD
ncbi:Cut9-interacting protein scn1 [Pseudocercospora fuligena]|uniref:Cut9-interacting protein scn1 n=1 Tax=Pseudocercospora fuligena TaxID=685502 RepID=A0A8H6VJQ0_9PEZI|nr:Cut9-interacting protein scn1 [Pseudocercospora fuligena]